MRFAIMTLFLGLGYLLQVFGGIALLAIFIFGIYTLFTTSMATGLMLIGGVVVGAWILQIISALLITIGTGAAAIGIKDEEN
ncbi:hypothetical protein Tel_16885 (plasmid) [Candidatus Tenderia electrophaga]|jgi:hypothetical protein|uniref:Uncharacterized protein n=1 Tax=Candidatus Tenderia electrophaga TaxID=1748243 RepID=A0A0S2TIE9_9GAMM|nr:hypothetical protein Tel_16885 [Candidatus Tenderia electrophaga]